MCLSCNCHARVLYVTHTLSNGSISRCDRYPHRVAEREGLFHAMKPNQRQDVLQVSADAGLRAVNNAMRRDGVTQAIREHRRFVVPTRKQNEVEVSVGEQLYCIEKFYDPLSCKACYTFNHLSLRPNCFGFRMACTNTHNRLPRVCASSRRGCERRSRCSCRATESMQHDTDSH